jgi:hypothetical protein
MATVTGTRRLLDISGNNISTAVSLEAEGTLLDSNGQSGTSNQVLISTATGVDWVDGSGSSIIGGPYVPLSGGSSTGQAMTGTLYGPGATFSVSGNNSTNLKVGDGFYRLEMGRTSIQARVVGSSGAAAPLSLNPNGGDVKFVGSGNVGIGTTSPSHKLDIYSNENIPLRVHRPSNANLNSTGAWGIGFSTRGDATTSTTDTRAGIFSYYNGNLFLAANNSNIASNPYASARLTILNSGNVEINNGQLSLGGTGRIQGVDTVTANTDAANKLYVDNAVAGVPQGDITAIVAGSGMTGTSLSGPIPTLNVIGGDGITANADDIEVDSTVVRTTGAQSIAGTKTFTTRINVDTSAGAEAMGLFTENNTAPIADSFAGNTSKSYIYFSTVSGGNDPGFIMHESSSSSSPDERNEGVLHLVPSDDNATNDYVSIHGTNDPDVLKLHTSGLIETVNLQLQLKSGSGSIYLNDGVSIEGDLSVSGGDITLGGTGRIQGVDTVSANTDAANKLYVDNAVAGVPQGDITGVGAGNGLTGTNLSGPIPTLNVGAGTGMTINADDIAVTPAQTGITSIYYDGLEIGGVSGTNSIAFSASKIAFTANSTAVGYISSSGFIPSANNTMALGTSTNKWSSVYATTFLGDLNGTINTSTTGVTQTAGNNTTKIATTAFVTAAITAAAPTVNDGTLTMTTSTGLDGGATFTANQSGNSAFAVSLDLSELTDMTQTMIGSDEFIVLDNSAERRKAASEIGLSIFNNDSGFLTTETGARMVQFNRSGINASTYTMLATVNGNNLASILKMTMTGTSGSVVFACTFDITVNHSTDIHVKSSNGDYTEVTLRITSNNNEDFSIEAKHNGGSTTTAEVCIYPLADEVITPTTTDPGYTGAEYEHTATEGWRFGGEDGNVESSNVIVDGKIGVGTTTPAGLLEVKGPEAYIYISDTTETDSGIIFRDVDAGLSQAAAIKYNSSNGKLQFYNNDTAAVRMTIDTAGNVGIGNTGPNYPLVVNGVSAANRFYIPNATATTAWVLQARNSNSTADSGLYFENGDAQLLLRDDSNNLNVRINSDSNSYINGGNLGIGITAPDAKLTVFRTVSNYAVNRGDVEARAGLSVKSSSSYDSKLNFATGLNSQQYIQGLNNAATTGRPIVLNPYGGYVGINTANLPTQQLDIISGTNNGIRISATDTQTWRDIGIRSYVTEGQANALADHTFIYTTNPSSGTEDPFGKFGATVIQGRDNGNSGFAIRLGNGGGHATRMWMGGTGATTFSNTVTATNFILSSDERLKENIEQVCDNRVKADWKTFELKTEKGQKRYGVIAQELEKTNPEFVREDSQGFKSVAYIDLLIAKIAELEARLEKLEK